MAIKKNRMISQEERDHKIEQMGLAELKKYLCMKNYQNPEKCEKCPGVKTCKAGQRAVVLLNEREKEKMAANDVVYSVNERFGKTQISIIQESRRTFEEACKQENPITFLMKRDDSSRNSARERLKYYMKKFPDIAKKYNFEEKLQSVMMPKGGSLPPDGIYPQTIVAMEKYKEASAQPDPIGFVMKKYGWDRKKAGHNFYQWRQRYGKAEEQKGEPTMEEEISIEDFLKENASGNEKTAGEEQPISFSKSDDFYGELNAKFYELEKEKEALQKRLKWVEKAQEALAMTANLFNPNSAIGKAFMNEQEHLAG